MTRISVTREFNIKMDSDFYIRKHLNATPNEARVSLDLGNLSRYTTAIDEDLGYIAAGMFACEGVLRAEKAKLDESISFLVEQSDRLKNDTVQSLLSQLIAFTLRSSPDVKILGVKRGARFSPKALQNDNRTPCLFSGGIDSLSGILSVNRKIGPAFGVFVSHDRMHGIVDRLSERYLKNRGIYVHDIVIQRGHSGIQQLRGFVYLVLGAIVARIHHSDKLVITETGQTMFLPQITALDEITLTTHPTLLAITKSLLHEGYGGNFSFYEPFANLTKAEVISLCEAKEAIPDTNSCITTRFANQPYSHCGTCYGCLVRRVSCVVAGTKDALYAKDVLVKDVGDSVMGGWRGAAISPSNLREVQALLRFARDIIEDKIDDVSRFKIESFSKHELFRRFAMDVLSSLYLLYGKTNTGQNSWISQFYAGCKKDKVLTPESADNRIAEVRDQKFQPDFEFRL